MQVTISPDLLFEMAALVYHRWSRAYDTLKRVKAETNDGSKDWPQFHAARLTAAQQDLAIWEARKNEATQLASLVNPTDSTP